MAKTTGSWRGAWVCIGMFALGGAVLWGLFLAPRGRSPASPDLPWAAPATPLRFVATDLGGQLGAGQRALDRIRAFEPDYVLVRNVRFDDVLPLAEGLGMARSFHPQLFQRPDPKDGSSPGDLLLSKHPLYDAGPVAGGGVRAVSVVDGVRFVVQCGGPVPAEKVPTVGSASGGDAAIVFDDAWELVETTTRLSNVGPAFYGAVLRARTARRPVAAIPAASAPTSTAPSPAR